ncbi:zinc finger protein ZAT1-like [Triticum dicoccoides]|uniref:zinc finger protein ZAT1-like n=1 Tax=Triticum dicoccoides TaxID=85692 RepID=UPI000E7AA717|nr:zinc finger protein ZAT1-like [Triticum dicoccoides]
MAKNTCKLCCRRFASPRALAGHMRSHSVKVARPQQISSASSASTSVAAAEDDARMAIQAHVLRGKPKRRARLAESDFSDRESEAEYPSQSPGAKRVHAGSRDAEPVSSVSDAATPEEDVARSLMMLSRDSWPAPPPSYRAADSDDAEAAPAPPAAEQKRTRFQCPACKKVFRSYQALGGHRASHVRGGRGGCCAPPLNPPPASTHLQPLPECEEGTKPPPHPHECPCCSRVFASGQALGGHKRPQLRPAAAAVAAHPAAAMKSLGLIDLNLPAPFEDVELSAVSDPFLAARPGH